MAGAKHLVICLSNVEKPPETCLLSCGQETRRRVWSTHLRALVTLDLRRWLGLFGVTAGPGIIVVDMGLKECEKRKTNK